MKKFTKLLCLLLLVCVLPLGLFACGDEPADTTTAQKPADEVTNWEELDFSGTTLRIGYNTVVAANITSTGAGNSLKYLRGPDESDPESDFARGDYLAAYERHEKVCSALNLTIGENFFYDMITWDGKPDSTLETIRNYNTTAGESTPTILIHQNYGMVRGGIEGLLYNALETKYTNYLDLDDEHWYRDMMEENTIDTSKIYMLLGDYFIDQFRMSFGVLFNTDIADTILPAEGGFEHLYDLVDRGEWTYDMMMEMAERAYTGEYGEELVMGAIADQGWIVRSFFASSGLDVFKRDAKGEAFYVQGQELDPIVDFVDKLQSMNNQLYFAYHWTADAQNTSKIDVTTTFINNGALFAVNQMVLSFEGANILGMDSPASILPNPKYVAGGDDNNDFSTNYGALVNDNAGSGGILLCAKPAQFTAATAFLQMMTEESDEFFTEYYEEGLKMKNNEVSPRHNDMLDYIHDGICSPMSFLYDNYCAKSLGDSDTYQTYSSIIYKQIDSGISFNTAWASQIGAKVNKWESIKTNFGTATAGK